VVAAANFSHIRSILALPRFAPSRIARPDLPAVANRLANAQISLDLLSRLGYKVVAVARGEEAIRYLLKNKADLLIHDMIMELPRHYDTVLGPGGVGLSGGQRQRLGLARALLGNPAFLVLDEPNANLDAAGETGLRDALVEIKKTGTTIVLVTHRTTILEVVDALMFVREGRLEAYGPPDAVYAHIKEKVVPEMEKAKAA